MTMNELVLPQGTIRYQDIGSGPAVVFVHGFLSDSRLWRNVIPHLSRTHRCIVPDWPLGSHELPMSADADLSPPGVAHLVADALDALGLDSVTLVGNDSGGAICQMVAAHHPARIARLVLTNCDALEVFPPREFEYMRTVVKIPGAIWLISRMLYHSRKQRHMSITYGRLSKQGLPDELIRSWVAPGVRSAGIRRDIKKFAVAVSSRFTLDAAEILAGRELPTLLVWGLEDRFFSIDLARRLQARLPGAELEEVPGAWTYLPEDQPELLARSIARFARPAQGTATAVHAS